MKKFLSSLLVCSMLVASVPCDVHGATVALNVKKATIQKGSSKTITLKNAKKKVIWSITKGKKLISSKKLGKYKQKIKITAKKPGNVVLKAKYNKKTYTCKITITKKNSASTSSVSKVTTEKTTGSNTTSSTTTQNNTNASTEKVVTTEKLTTEKGTTEKVTTEKVTTQQVTTEKATTEIPTTEHVHTEVLWGTKDIHSKCGTCGEVVSSTHNMKYQDKVESTYTEKGYEKYSCSCGYSYTVELPLKPHTCEAIDGGTEDCHSKCKLCGKTMDGESAHTFNVFKKSISTCYSHGIEYHVCDCGYSYNSELPLEEHTVDPETHICTVCGALDEQSAEYKIDISDAQDSSILAYGYKETYEWTSDFKQNSYDYYNIIIKVNKENATLKQEVKNPDTFFGSNIPRNQIFKISAYNNGRVKANKNSSYLFYGIGSDTGGSDKIYGINSYRGIHYSVDYPKVYDYSWLDTSDVTDMSYMFAESRAFTHDSSVNNVLDFDTSKVTTMESMFDNANTRRVYFGDKFVSDSLTNVNYMFYNIEGNYINLNNFFLSRSYLVDSNIQDIYKESETLITGRVIFKAKEKVVNWISRVFAKAETNTLED